MFGFYVVCGSVGASDIVVHGLKFHSVPTWGFISMRLTVPVKWQSRESPGERSVGRPWPR